MMTKEALNTLRSRYETTSHEMVAKIQNICTMMYENKDQFSFYRAILTRILYNRGT